MNNFVTNTIEQKTFPDSKLTTLQLHKTNNSPITPNEIRVISKQLLQKAPKGTKLSIRALGVDKWNSYGWTTLQKFDKDLQVQDEEEYYEGKVRDTSKFKKFSQIQLIVLKPNN